MRIKLTGQIANPSISSAVYTSVITTVEVGRADTVVFRVLTIVRKIYAGTEVGGYHDTPRQSIKGGYF